MKKLVFLFSVALLAISINAKCQTFYYVGNLQIIPSNPTTADNIKINVIGSFASTGSYIVNHNIAVNGFQVDLTINCGDPGGFAVIVPHDTIFTIGLLQAGTYTINLSGFALGDYVQPPSKTFVVTGLNEIAANPINENHTNLYPNPCTDKIFINSDNNNVVETEIYNINGSLILKNNFDKNGIIDISNIEQGIYFIRLIEENNIEIQKIIKY